MIGLGRMGANMVRRLLRGGHECVVFDANVGNVKLSLPAITAIHTGKQLAEELKEMNIGAAAPESQNRRCAESCGQQRF